MSLSTASNWLWNFAIGYATPYLVDQSTSGPTGIKAADLGVKVFFIWGSTCVGCWIFTYFCIPETKGLSLEQIDLLYHHTTPRKSIAYRAMVLERNIHAKDVNGGGVDLEGLHRGGHSGGTGAGDDISEEDEKKAAVTHSETV
jgi:SP family sugar:H+ symporter-like MFS transporter